MTSTSIESDFVESTVDVALIVTFPALSPVTSPSLETVATLVSLEVQVTVAGAQYVVTTVAVNCEGLAVETVSAPLIVTLVTPATSVVSSFTVIVPM